MRKFISKKQLLAMIPYSWTHIQRLIEAGLFPEPAKPNGYAVKEPKNAKSFWDYDEIVQWMDHWLEKRDSKVAPS